MNIIRLLTGGPAESRGPIVVFALLSSVGNAGLVALVNRAAEESLLGAAPEAHLLGAYALTLVFFLIANRASLRLANGYVQSRIEATRRRIVNKIRKVDLRTLERLGQGDVYVTVLQETDHLAQTMPLLIGAAQSALLVVFILFYIATLSLISFAFVTVFIALAMLFFVLKQRALMSALAEVHHGEADVLDSLDHFTRGFQEIRLNADKNDALFKHFSEVAYRLKYVVTSLGGRWVSLLQFSNAFIFLLVGSVVFVLPLFFEGYTDTIYKITAAAVFILGPVAAIISVVRLIGRAEAGLTHVFALERKLDAGTGVRVPTDRRRPERFAGFRTLAMEGVSFGYRDANEAVTFGIGPIDLAIRRGEIVFLTGGNGSGKSTALKLLCGLYRPDGGRIACDGTPVEPETLQDYRALFSAIFTDFHLFDRLYGLGEVDPGEVERLIARMELTGIVGFADGRFTTTDLSTGQRKRLALIVALLEDREVYVLDEWAADQDRHFREIFYRQILPDLKARGKTVVAVTHDDHYWDACDRRLSLDLGAIQRVEG